MPNALPEPTAPQDGETPIALLTDASLVKMFEVSCAYTHPAEAPSDELRAYQAELRAELRSRLSSLSTELVRVRGALTTIHRDFDCVCVIDAKCQTCIAADALGGLVPPDASPRRTE